MLRDLRRIRPDLCAAFLRELPRGRAGVLDRLRRAMSREALPAGPDDDPLGALPPSAPRDRFAAELAGSAANLALAFVAEQERRATFPQVGGVLDWAGEQARRDPGFSPLALFEQAVVEGHHQHPCCRTRTGMSADEVLRYAPEWAPLVPLAVVAVPRHRCRTAGGDMSALLRAQHRQVADAAAAVLPDPDQYLLLPVHPWQLEHVIRPRYSGAVVELPPEAGIPARPLMSLRTLAPAGNRLASHLKTAVDVQMTSAVRTVSAAAVHNGPALSALLAEVGARENFDGTFHVLAEQAAGCYVGPDGPVRSLAAVAREPAERHAAPGEVVMPVAALSARCPMSGRPLLTELTPDPEGWLARYCALAAAPVLTLLTRWGIALEAHGQNLLVVLRDGWPVRVLYRDFGGVRVSSRRLAERGIDPPPLAGDIPTDDCDELPTKVAASFVMNHLAELVPTLPGRPWHVVADAFRQVYRDLAGRDEAFLFGPRLPVKAVVSMRLADDPLADRWTWLPNPLVSRP